MSNVSMWLGLTGVAFAEDMGWGDWDCRTPSVGKRSTLSPKLQGRRKQKNQAAKLSRRKNR